MTLAEAIDNGGRRSGNYIRKFSYDLHIPERRSGIDRRSGFDRRSGPLYHIGDKERRQMVQ